ncbi:MAG: DUF1778 domain-containing protein [Acidobacteriia bacterium]|nr:DUF1778 domain-containing protein [Terriglobia bacterium]
MASAPIATRKKRINVRATSREAKLIRIGAKLRGVNMTEFILSSASKEAEQMLADQRHFEISAEAWKEFTAALDRPARIKPRLQRLFAEPSVLDR